MSTTRQRRPGVRGRYEALLWRTMDALGVSESIERKVVAAVGIQFLVTVGIFLTQFLIAGTAAYVVSGILFLGSVVAIYNTLLIVRRDFAGPIRALERQAEAIAAGDVDGASDVRADGQSADDAAAALASEFRAEDAETATWTGGSTAALARFDADASDAELIAAVREAVQ